MVRGFGGLSNFNAENDQAATTWLDKFWVRPLFRSSCIPERRASVLSSMLSGRRLTGEGRNNGGVYGQLASSPEGQTVCYDFDTSVVDAVDGRC